MHVFVLSYKKGVQLTPAVQHQGQKIQKLFGVWKEGSGGEEKDPTAVPFQEKLIKLTLCKISEDPHERETLQARLH